jgi:hypothetical protein
VVEPLGALRTISNVCFTNSYPYEIFGTVCFEDDVPLLESTCAAHAKNASSTASTFFCSKLVRITLIHLDCSESMVVGADLTAVDFVVSHLSPDAARPRAFATVEVAGTV